MQKKLGTTPRSSKDIPRQESDTGQVDTMRNASDLARRTFAMTANGDRPKRVDVLNDQEADSLLPGVLTLSLINKELEEVEHQLAWRSNLSWKAFLVLGGAMLTVSNWLYTSTRVNQHLDELLASRLDALVS